MQTSERTSSFKNFLLQVEIKLENTTAYLPETTRKAWSRTGPTLTLQPETKLGLHRRALLLRDQQQTRFNTKMSVYFEIDTIQLPKRKLQTFWSQSCEVCFCLHGLLWRSSDVTGASVCATQHRSGSGSSLKCHFKARVNVSPVGNWTQAVFYLARERQCGGYFLHGQVPDVRCERASAGRAAASLLAARVADQMTRLALQNWWQDVVEACCALEQCCKIGSLAGQTSRGQGHGGGRRRWHRPSHRANASGGSGRSGYCRGRAASSPVLSSTCFPRSESSTSGSRWGWTAHSFQLRSVWETAERTGTSSSGYYCGLLPDVAPGCQRHNMATQGCSTNQRAENFHYVIMHSTDLRKFGSHSAVMFNKAFK